MSVPQNETLFSASELYSSGETLPDNVVGRGESPEPDITPSNGRVPAHAAEPVDDFHALALRETAENQGVSTPFDAKRANTGHGPRPWTALPGSGKKPPRKPRGTSYPRDESRADIGFDPNPRTDALAKFRSTPQPGETYTGAGLDGMHRHSAILGHEIVGRLAKAGGLSRYQVAIETARLQRRTPRSRK